MHKQFLVHVTKRCEKHVKYHSAATDKHVKHPARPQTGNNVPKNHFSWVSVLFVINFLMPEYLRKYVTYLSAATENCVKRPSAPTNCAIMVTVIYGRHPRLLGLPYVPMFRNNHVSCILVLFVNNFLICMT